MIVGVCLFTVGCYCWPVCHRTVSHIFWIFSTLCRCTAMAALAVSCIVPQVCRGRGITCHFWLQSTKVTVQWNLLPLSISDQIYKNDRHASLRLFVCFFNSISHLHWTAHCCVFHHVAATQTKMKKEFIVTNSIYCIECLFCIIVNNVIFCIFLRSLLRLIVRENQLFY